MTYEHCMGLDSTLHATCMQSQYGIFGLERRRNPRLLAGEMLRRNSADKLLMEFKNSQHDVNFLFYAHLACYRRAASELLTGCSIGVPATKAMLRETKLKKNS